MPLRRDCRDTSHTDLAKLTVLKVNESLSPEQTSIEAELTIVTGKTAFQIEAGTKCMRDFLDTFHPKNCCRQSSGVLRQ